MYAVIEIGQQADSNWVLFSNAHLSASGALISMEQALYLVAQGLIVSGKLNDALITNVLHLTSG